jgi:hypothetical protein
MEDIKTSDDKELCAFEGCEKEAKARGLCRIHYDRMLRQGRLEEFPRKSKKKKAPIPSPLIKKLIPQKNEYEIKLIFDDDYKNLFSKLEKTAKKEFRTIELQVLYLIDQGLEAGI